MGLRALGYYAGKALEKNLTNFRIVQCKRMTETTVFLATITEKLWGKQIPEFNDLNYEGVTSTEVCILL